MAHNTGALLGYSDVRTLGCTCFKLSFHADFLHFGQQDFWSSLAIED